MEEEDVDAQLWGDLESDSEEESESEEESDEGDEAENAGLITPAET